MAKCQVLMLQSLKKPDWLEVGCLEVGVKCKQSHVVVKCSVDHENA